MAAYDDDSSEGEDNFTSTNVLLGYASKEATDDAISHLGGYPTWPEDGAAPSGEFSKCRVCNSLLSLLLELNGDLPERFAGHERRLYLFACRRKACRRKEGSIRGLRATRTSRIPERGPTSSESNPPRQSQAQEPVPRPDLGSSIFGAKPGTSSAEKHVNPFSSPSAPPTGANPFASASSLAAKPPQRPDPEPAATLPQTFADKVRISSDPTDPVIPAAQPQGSPRPWPAVSDFPTPYSGYHLDADYETLDTEPIATVPGNAKLDMDLDGDGAGPSTSSSSAAVGQDRDKDLQEAFESSMDKTFQKFADRVAQNPEQVLRYEFGGQPLLYAREDAVGRALSCSEVWQGSGGGARVGTSGPAGSGRVPRCGGCGAERVFELQLMPNAIAELEAEEEGVDGMEWGTIILEVCSKDCIPRGVSAGEVGYTEEWVGVQWEELVRR